MGRSSDHWIDFDMFGHQMVTHLNPDLGSDGKVSNLFNPVDAKSVPVPHFGVVLTMDDWKALAERAKTFVDEFLIDPYIRFEGEPGEQATMFFSDPSGNALEFKAFKDIEQDLFRETKLFYLDLSTAQNRLVQCWPDSTTAQKTLTLLNHK